MKELESPTSSVCGKNYSVFIDSEIVEMQQESTMRGLEEVLRYWFMSPLLTYGLGTYLAGVLGFFVPMVILEAVIRRKFMEQHLIVYGKNPTPRKELVEKVQKEVLDFKGQLKNATINIVGPMAIGNALSFSLVGPYVFGMPSEVLPSPLQFVVQLVLLELVGDFFLFAFHKLEHDYFWDCHKFHHQLTTPTPVSTITIGQIDATLQGGVPIILAGLIIQPHIVTLYAYIFLRIAENVVNHSGIDHWLLDLITLKCLPGRAPVSFHDHHHKYGNRAKGAKNFGENFWFWDFLAGTMAKPQGVAAVKVDGRDKNE